MPFNCTVSSRGARLIAFLTLSEAVVRILSPRRSRQVAMDKDAQSISGLSDLRSLPRPSRAVEDAIHNHYDCPATASRFKVDYLNSSFSVFRSLFFPWLNDQLTYVSCRSPLKMNSSWFVVERKPDNRLMMWKGPTLRWSVPFSILSQIKRSSRFAFCEFCIWSHKFSVIRIIFCFLFSANWKHVADLVD